MTHKCCRSFDGVEIGNEPENGSALNGAESNGVCCVTKVRHGVSQNGSTTVNNNVEHEISPPPAAVASDSLLDERLASIRETADYLMSRTKLRPRIAIVCGTGLGSLGELVTDAKSFAYEDIPHFAKTRVSGHAGRLLFGMLNGRCVVCMLGRVHSYEGHSMWQLTFPIRVFQAIGIRIMLITNASGSIREDFLPADLMIIKDHINLPGLSGLNPLIGQNDDRLGPRFPAMSNAYDPELRRLLRRTADDLGQQSFVREGVYLCQTGPCYETVAETIMARTIGADVVGMSTCPEVIVARHGRPQIRCVGLSLITNSCVMTYDVGDDVAANHDEIVVIADRRADDLRRLVSTFVGKLPNTDDDVIGNGM